MNTSHRVLAALAGVAVVAACSGGSDEPTTGSRDLPQGGDAMALDPKDFTTKIDNPYLPLVPGTQSTFREVAGDGSIATVVVTVTSTTRKIANGVTARVVRDTGSENGQIIEDTFDWYAQDAEGNVWYLGEDTAEFEDGKKVSTGGSFEAGVDGAMAGVAMPAHPRPGLAYRQEYYRGEAEDNGEVLSSHEMVDVTYGHFTSALLTKDTSAIEPDVLEYKLYARGVGQVLALDIAGGSGREELLTVKKVPAGTATGPLGHPDE